MRTPGSGTGRGIGKGVVRTVAAGLAGLCLLLQVPASLPMARVPVATGVDPSLAASAMASPAAETYEAYLQRYAVEPRPILELEAIPPDGTLNEGDRISLRFDVPSTGLYSVTVRYRPTGEATGQTRIRVSLDLDGGIPFESAASLYLARPQYRVDPAPRTDARGNQIQPGYAEPAEPMEALLQDPAGRYDEPLFVRLEAGSREIGLTAEMGSLVLYAMRVANRVPSPSYTEYASRCAEEGFRPATGSMQLLQAEDFHLRSDSTITSDFDKSDLATQPNDPVRLVLNMVPGTRFQNPGQWIRWQVDIPEDGLYRIALRVRQAYKSGFFASRRLLVDGEAPFAECGTLRFESSNGWYIRTLGDERGDFLFGFRKGSHEIALEVVPGSFSAITRQLDGVIYRLNTLYRKVVMVAGTSPDKYRDYKLETEVPGLTDELDALRAELEGIEAEVVRINGGAGGELTSIRTLINQLGVYQRYPDKLARMILTFKSAVEALSVWNMNARQQPLDIDFMAVAPPDSALPDERAGFLPSLWFSLQRLLATFLADYGTIGDIYDKRDAIEVWTALGRDQLQIVKDMVDNDFIPSTGIKVNVMLVPTGIREAVLAGRSPDVALFISSDEPMNLAIRNALLHLDAFDTFPDVSARFRGETMKPFLIGGRCYALPLTESFPVLFARTDILDEMGLGVPETWDDMNRVAAVLQRKNMEVGIPSSLGMFATLLLQNGGSFYDETMTRTNFEQEPAMAAFRMWTDYFALYDYPLQFDFLNRFRSGEMPIGIAHYPMYMALQVLAPEIASRWSMFRMPGIRQADGSIRRTVNSSGATGLGTSPGLEQSLSAGVLFASSDDRESAWRFLDWFTSTDVQSRFGLLQEAVLGPSARYAAANLAAFDRLPWEAGPRSVIRSQWEDVVLMPEIPGSYYVARDINNAFRRVIYYYENPVDTLNRYNNRINKELERKRREFPMTTGGLRP